MDPHTPTVDLPPLLPALDAADADVLQAHTTVREVPAGGVLLRAGRADRILVWLRAGTAQARIEMNGQHFTVSRFQPGAILGELGFFDPDHVRAAEVVADTDVVISVLTWSAYGAMVSAGEPLVAALENEVLSQLAARMDATSAQLGALLVAPTASTHRAAAGIEPGSGA